MTVWCAREIDGYAAADSSARACDEGYWFIHLDFSVADSAASMALEISSKRKGLYERFAVDEYGWRTRDTARNTFPIIFFYGFRQLRIVERCYGARRVDSVIESELSKLHLELLRGDLARLLKQYRRKAMPVSAFMVSK